MLHSTLRKTLAVSTSLLGIALTLPVLAHHGYTGEYNAAQPIYMEGTVEQVTIAYPHVEMTVRVAGQATVPAQLPRITDVGIADVSKKMTVAAPGTYPLQVAGLQKELDGRIAKGDKIALVALQNCLPPNQYRTRWIRIAAGDVVSLAGRTQTEVEGCKAK
jgi:hypothetical protein